MAPLARGPEVVIGTNEAQGVGTFQHAENSLPRGSVERNDAMAGYVLAVCDGRRAGKDDLPPMVVPVFMRELDSL